MPGPFLPLKTGLQAVSMQLLSTLTSTAHFMTCYFFYLSHWIEWGTGKGAKMCPPDFSFPSTRSPVYKPALWILTQITLPTPTGMKTKPGEGASAGLLAATEASSPFRKQLPPPSSLIPPLFTPATGREALHWQMGCVGPHQHTLVSGAESHPPAVPATDLRWPGAHRIHGNTLGFQ